MNVTLEEILHLQSEDEARSNCLLFTLIECTKIHNINPEDYLRCIFEQAADTDG